MAVNEMISREDTSSELPAGFDLGQLKGLLLDSVADLVVFQDLSSHVLWANEVASRSVGLQGGDLVGRLCHEIWHQRSDVCHGCPVVRAQTTRKAEEGEVVSPDGRAWMIRAFPVRRAAEESLLGILEIATEVTERRRLVEALRNSERRFRTLFDSSPDPIAVTTAEGVFIDANEAMTACFGYTLDEMRRMSATDFYIDPHDREKLRQIIGKRGTVQGHEARLRTRDGTVLLCSLTVSAASDAGGDANYHYSIIRDITADREREEKVAYLAAHDPLTGLVNRAEFEHRLALGMALARHRGSSLAVLYMDLHGLKRANDTLGHAAGDQVLCEAASRVSRAVRPIDTLGRLGGDEFALVVPEIESRDEAVHLANQAIGTFMPPFLVEGKAFPIAVSVGIALYPEDADNAFDLVRKADVAMYKAKATGTNRHALYGENLI